MPSATNGPVWLNNLNRARARSESASIKVPALETIATTSCRTVCATPGAGSESPSQRSANRHVKSRTRSVPVPNRTATKNSSTSGLGSTPVHTAASATSPRAINSEMPIVASGTSARKSERYTMSRMIKSSTTTTITATSSVRCTASMYALPSAASPDQTSSRPAGTARLSDADLRLRTSASARGATQSASSAATTSCVVPSELTSRAATSGSEPGPSTRMILPAETAAPAPAVCGTSDSRRAASNRCAKAAANRRSASVKPDGRRITATATEPWLRSGQALRISRAASMLSASSGKRIPNDSAASRVRSGAVAMTSPAASTQSATASHGRFVIISPRPLRVRRANQSVATSRG